jgi:hypothetical protein
MRSTFSAYEEKSILPPEFRRIACDPRTCPNAGGMDFSTLRKFRTASLFALIESAIRKRIAIVWCTHQFLMVPHIRMILQQALRKDRAAYTPGLLTIRVQVHAPTSGAAIMNGKNQNYSDRSSAEPFGLPRPVRTPEGKRF